MAGILELLGLPYTGSGPECLALVRHKARTKWLLQGAGVSTAAFLLLNAAEKAVPREAVERLLALGPLIVKPAAEDASLGLSTDSVVTDLAALERQTDSIRSRYGDVLIEQFIAGREFNVGIIALPEPQALPLAEIDFQAAGTRPQKWQIVTYDAKWSPDSDEDRATPVRCPAEVEPDLADRLRQAALAAFRLTGCRDYARVDLRVDSQGRAFVLEVNGNPDIGPQAGLARALRASGMDYDRIRAATCGACPEPRRRPKNKTAGHRLAGGLIVVRIAGSRRRRLRGQRHSRPALRSRGPCAVGADGRRLRDVQA